MRLLNYWPTPEDADVSAVAEEVFRAYGPRIYGLVRRLLGTETEAEAVTLDVLLEVVSRLGHAPGEDGLTAWLHRVTVRAVQGCRRRWGARRRHGVAAGEGRDEVERALVRLPEVYRDVLVLADVEGLASTEVGALLGMSLRAVQARLHRARLLLRQALAVPFGS
jgi:RNA polymerase sigma-70 factor, ECF subfamily